ncbi:MAG: peptidylprolyl isomerase [Ruminiclostridium sp.]|nr:peptidylprolyl isomerase [Ruminiclostridium sp.]
MKKIMRRVLGGALSLVMMLGLLTGCSGGAQDPVQEVMGYEGSTVLFTVDGNDVTAADYFFWMAQNADYVASYFTGMGLEMDWTNNLGGSQDMDSYVKDASMDTAVLYSIVKAKAAEYGYEMGKEDEEAYEADLASAKEELGGEEEYEDFLLTMCITDEGMRDMSTVGVLYNQMAEGLFREGGEYAATPEDLTAYAEENDLLCAKHILLMTQDMATGEALPEADAAAQKTLAEDILAQLQAVEDPAELETKFDELMNEHSQDTGLAAYPNGYVFTAGEMVAEFEEATRALEFGAVSGIVESSYGYHIILRLDPAESEEVQTTWQAAEMDALIQQWTEEAVIETTETYDNLTTAEFYTNLTAYRETIAPAEETEDAATTEETDGAAEESTEEAPADQAEDAATQEETTEEAPAEGEAAE